MIAGVQNYFTTLRDDFRLVVKSVKGDYGTEDKKILDARAKQAAIRILSSFTFVLGAALTLKGIVSLASSFALNIALAILGVLTSIVSYDVYRMSKDYCAETFLQIKDRVMAEFENTRNDFLNEDSIKTIFFTKHTAFKPFWDCILPRFFKGTSK